MRECGYVKLHELKKFVKTLPEDAVSREIILDERDKLPFRECMSKIDLWIRLIERDLKRIENEK
ncbi:hypothetical protein [Geoglobus acetivorans]|uniref:HEPN domain-containing protein n=1 Tax=Geoglobus acetivorans TaxID=565033 RepID=A0A0A7GE39_GEOAI|nr:hypothetical protein GACE_1249 [Geoglobus acetivorans]